MGLNIYRFDKEFKPHLGYHYGVSLLGINTIAKSVKLPNIEIKTDDSKRFYGNTALTFPIYNFSSKQLDITFVLDEDLNLLDELSGNFNFIQPPGKNNIDIDVFEFEDDLVTVKKHFKYQCRLLEFSQPDFSNTGSPGFAEITASFIVDEVIIVELNDNTKDLDDSTFTTITKTASPAGKQHLQPNNGGDEKFYKEQSKKEKKTADDKEKKFLEELAKLYNEEDTREEQNTIDYYKIETEKPKEQKSEEIKENKEKEIEPTISSNDPTAEELNDGYENQGRKTGGDQTPTKGIDSSKSETGGQSAADAAAKAKEKRDKEEAAKSKKTEGTDVPKSEEKDKLESKQTKNHLTDGVNSSSKYTDREDELAYQMMRGNVGNGDPRKIKAKDLGYNDTEIKNAQAIVNEKKWNDLKKRHDQRVKDGKATEKPVVPTKGIDSRQPEESHGTPTQQNGQNTGGQSAANAAAKAKAQADKKNTPAPVKEDKKQNQPPKQNPDIKKEDKKEVPKTEPKKEEPKKEIKKEEPKKEEEKPKEPPSKAIGFATEEEYKKAKEKYFEERSKASSDECMNTMMKLYDDEIGEGKKYKNKYVAERSLFFREKLDKASKEGWQKGASEYDAKHKSEYEKIKAYEDSKK